MFSGHGGLDVAAAATTGGRVVWHAENDPAAALLLDRRFPGVPNLGDVAAVNWATVDPVDVLCAGFPCQDVSAAGSRAGITDGERSGLWTEVVAAISALRPGLVLLENVTGLYFAEGTIHGPDDPLRCVCGFAAGPGSLDLEAAARPPARPRPVPDRPATTAGADVPTVRRHHRPDRRGPVAMDHRRRPPHQDAHPPAGPTDQDRRAGRPGTRPRQHTRGDAAGHQPPPRTGPARTELDCPCCGRRMGGTANEPVRAGGLGVVLWSLAQIGYDTQWCDLPASTVGAAHHRDRWFLLAHPTGRPPAPLTGHLTVPPAATGDLLPTPRATEGPKASPNQHGSYGDLMLTSAVLQRIPAAATADGHVDLTGTHPSLDDALALATPDGTHRTLTVSTAAHTGGANLFGDAGWHEPAQATTGVPVRDWGPYTDAIARWASVTGTTPPHPAEPRRQGPRLSVPFTEWLMGLPAGWVTGIEGISRNDRLRLLGNGVVPAQAAAAYLTLAQRAHADHTGRAAA